MKLLTDIAAFGSDGSRKAQAFALAGTALLAGPQLGLEYQACVDFAKLAAVFILGRSIHDFALAWRGQ